MSCYASLAPYYDSLTGDVPYGAFVDFYEKVFGIYGVKARTVLDLACGTGTVACLMAARGYEMICVDGSSEMLAAAAEKTCAVEPRPLFICQRMESLDLYGTVDAAVCSLDGMNYIEPEKMALVLHRVHLFLEPGGVFVFDVNAPEKLRGLDGGMFIDETEDVFCVWRAEFDAEMNACLYGLDIFSREGEKWIRSREEHAEYAYEPENLAGQLAAEGFTDVKILTDLTAGGPFDERERIFIAARKPELR